jgi:hypothetical protein
LAIPSTPEPRFDRSWTWYRPLFAARCEVSAGRQGSVGDRGLARYRPGHRYRVGGSGRDCRDRLRARRGSPDQVLRSLTSSRCGPRRDGRL